MTYLQSLLFMISMLIAAISGTFVAVAIVIILKFMLEDYPLILAVILLFLAILSGALFIYLLTNV